MNERFRTSLTERLLAPPSGRPFNLIIAGVGGQGNVLAARVLGSALLSSGFEVAVGDVFGLAQRGGAVASHVRFHRGRPLAPLVPAGDLDVVLGIEPLEALRVLVEYGRAETQVVTNERVVPPAGVLQGRASYPSEESLFGAMGELAARVVRLDAAAAARAAGAPKSANMVMLGALSGLGILPLGPERLRAELDRLPRRLRDENLLALTLGEKAVGDRA